MSVEEDFLVAFVALHGDQAARAAAIAAIPSWSQSNASLLDAMRSRSELDAAEIQRIESVVQSRLAYFDGDVSKAFGALFRSLFDAENIARSRVFFAALTAKAQNPNESAAERFRRDRLQGAGGLGQVWLAYDPVLGRRIALKEIRPELNGKAEFVQRFVREAMITSRLEHPNIVPVHEFCRQDGDGNAHPFYTMRFVEGRTLTEEINAFHHERLEGRFDRIAFSRLLDAFVDVCQAIEYAHKHGVLHRDLKPENVMLGRYGEVVVLDWGLAKEIGENTTKDSASVLLTDDSSGQTHAGAIIGTPGFMAPEQATGAADAYSELTDIYGLGAVLFAILTGQAPHARRPNETRDQLFARIAIGPTPNVREVEPKISRTLASITARAMALKPADRYSSAGMLIDDIERWVAGEPIQQFREPAWQRFIRWVLRWRRTITAVGFGLLLTLITTAVFRTHGRVSLHSHISQQLLDSRDASLAFANEMIRTGERLAAETRGLGELGSVFQLMEARQAGDAASIDKAKRRVEQAFRSFVQRERRAVRISLVTLEKEPRELLAFRRDEGAAVEDAGADSSSFVESAVRGRTQFAQLGHERIYLDRTIAYVDAKRPARLVWPRVRLVAPAASETGATATAAIVAEMVYGLLNPSLAPEIDRENENLETDWFFVDHRGAVLWSDPGRYSKLSELRAGAPIVEFIPELAPYFDEPPLDEELKISKSPNIESVVFARPMRMPYFYPAERFVVVAATPHSHVAEVADQQGLRIIVAALLVTCIGLSVGLLAGSAMAGAVRQMNRGYD